MPKWSDIVTLVRDDESVTDNMGVAKKTGETYREVFCNEKSTNYNEFFMAHQAGINTQVRLELYTCEYDREGTVIFNGKRYKVVRAHKSDNGEFIELSLTDLPKRGTSVGAV